MCLLTILVLLQRVIDVHFVYEKNSWKYIERNAIFVWVASYNYLDTLNFIILRQCKYAFLSYRQLKLSLVFKLFVICLYNAMRLQYVFEINIVSCNKSRF